MNTLLEQRADELVAGRQQQALAAFEAEYQELLAPITGSGFTYRVIPAQGTGLRMVFESASTGQTVSFNLLDTGRLSAAAITSITPSQLTEILAEHVVNWRKLQELYQWEQKLKLFRLLGQTWPYLAVLTSVVAVVCACLALEYWHRHLPVPVGKLWIGLGYFLVPALVAFVTDWCYKFNRRFLAEAISLQLVQTANA